MVFCRLVMSRETQGDSFNKLRPLETDTSDGHGKTTGSASPGIWAARRESWQTNRVRAGVGVSRAATREIHARSAGSPSAADRSRRMVREAAGWEAKDKSASSPMSIQTAERLRGRRARRRTRLDNSELAARGFLFEGSLFGGFLRRRLGDRFLGRRLAH